MDSFEQAFLEQLKHGHNGVACFERIQELLREGRSECKESQKHYKRERAVAAVRISLGERLTQFIQSSKRPEVTQSQSAFVIR